MKQVEILRVRDKRTLSEFVELPYRLYRDDPYWVPPLRIAQKELLDRAKHPFYRNAALECFLARSAGEVVGRIAAIMDRTYNEFQGEKTGFFGFFECRQDQETATALFDAARDWLGEQGAEAVRGPMNPSTNYECGLLIEGFDSSPCVMMTYNPPYYAGLIEGAGFRKAKDLLAYFGRPSEAHGEKSERVAARALAAHEIRVRSINVKDFQAEVEKVWKVYNSAWERNWGFVPMSREEFALMSREMKPILKPALVLIGERAGEVVAFALGLPDINQALKHAGGRLFPFGLLKILYYQRSVKKFRILALGVLKECRTTGLAAALYAGLIREAARLGYTECEMSWILEDNVLMNRSLEALGVRKYKTYRIYEWN